LMSRLLKWQHLARPLIGAAFKALERRCESY
jgi:hypothetical protein